MEHSTDSARSEHPGGKVRSLTVEDLRARPLKYFAFATRGERRTGGKAIPWTRERCPAPELGRLASGRGNLGLCSSELRRRRSQPRLSTILQSHGRLLRPVDLPGRNLVAISQTEAAPINTSFASSPIALRAGTDNNMVPSNHQMSALVSSSNRTLTQACHCSYLPTAPAAPWSPQPAQSNRPR